MHKIFHALSEPHRLQMLDRLSASHCTVGELSEAVKLGQPQTSKHLRLLKQAGLVTARIDGPKRIYSLRPEALGDIHLWLDRYRAIWGARFDQLDALLADETRQKRGNDNDT